MHKFWKSLKPGSGPKPKTSAGTFHVSGGSSDGGSSSGSRSGSSTHPPRESATSTSNEPPEFAVPFTEHRLSTDLRSSLELGKPAASAGVTGPPHLATVVHTEEKHRRKKRGDMPGVRVSSGSATGDGGINGKIPGATHKEGRSHGRKSKTISHSAGDILEAIDQEHMEDDTGTGNVASAVNYYVNTQKPGASSDEPAAALLAGAPGPPPVRARPKKPARRHPTSVQLHKDQIPESGNADRGAISDDEGRSGSAGAGSHKDKNRDKNLPKTIKVFAFLAAGQTEVRSLLVTPSTTVKEVLVDSLERFAIDNKHTQDYVLCDVIGRSADAHTGSTWRAECVRALGMNDKPLLVSTLWKPEHGYERRFEMKKREFPVGASMRGAPRLSHHHLDSVSGRRRTAGGNGPMNGERSAKHKSLPGLGYNTISAAMVSAITERKVGGGAAHVGKDRSCQTEPNLVSPNEVHLPAHPYLICVSCTREVLDADSSVVSKVFILSGTETVVGSDPSRRGHSHYLYLRVADILHNHCTIYRKSTAVTAVDGNSSEEYEIAAASSAALVYINNIQQAACKLHAGDIVTLGKHVAFMFNNPASCSAPATAGHTDSGKPWWSSRKASHSDHFTDSMADSSESLEQMSINSGGGSEQGGGAGHDVKHVRDVYDRSRSLKVPYNVNKEEDILHAALTADVKHKNCPLLAAYLLSATIDYSSAYFTAEHTTSLLSKVSERLQEVIWERTNDITDKQKSIPDDGCLQIEVLLPYLRPLLYWLANCLEFRHFLKDQMLRTPALAAAATNTSGSVSTDMELQGVIEEMVLYIFQQIVYYVTKVLYEKLPGVSYDYRKLSVETAHADSSSDPAPVSTDSGSGHRYVEESKAATTEVITILDRSLKLMQDVCLHPEMIKQLYAYLFYFLDTSLFNSIMEMGSGSGYYHQLVHIKTNFHRITYWAKQSNIYEVIVEYCRKVPDVADLLARNTEDLVKRNWSELCEDYRNLSFSQLYHILSRYHIDSRDNSDVNTPQHWFPDGIEKCTEGRLLETFNRHPPVQQPISDFVIDPCSPNIDVRVLNVINSLKQHLDDDKDSGLSLSHLSRPPAGVAGSCSSSSVLTMPSPTSSSNSREGASDAPPPPAHPPPPPAGELLRVRSVSSSAAVDESMKLETSVEELKHLSYYTPVPYGGTLPTVDEGSAVPAPPRLPPPASNASDTGNQPAAQAADSPTPELRKWKSFGQDLEASHSCSDDGLAAGGARTGSSPNLSATNGTTDQASEQLVSVVKVRDERSYADVEFKDTIDGKQMVSGEELARQADVDNADCLYYVSVIKGEKGFGIGFVDGKKLKQRVSGIYIGAVSANGPAQGKVQQGDRVLAINQQSVLSIEYATAMRMIRDSESSHMTLLLAAAAASATNDAEC